MPIGLVFHSDTPYTPGLKPMAERNSGVPEEKRIEFRIGINLGDIILPFHGTLLKPIVGNRSLGPDVLRHIWGHCRWLNIPSAP